MRLLFFDFLRADEVNLLPFFADLLPMMIIISDHNKNSQKLLPALDFTLVYHLYLKKKIVIVQFHYRKSLEDERKCKELTTYTSREMYLCISYTSFSWLVRSGKCVAICAQRAYTFCLLFLQLIRCIRQTMHRNFSAINHQQMESGNYQDINIYYDCG